MKNNKHLYFAEVVESSLYRWMAQSWSWNKFPGFGSVVVIEQDDKDIFGLVYEIQTGSSDPTRMPHAYQKTEEELLRDQPQIFEFLRTIFSIMPLGFKDKSYIYAMPEKPPKIHSFVRQASAQELDNLDVSLCLPLIFSNVSCQNIDELLVAFLRNFLSRDSLALNSFMEQYSLLCGSDYRRLRLFVNRVEFFLNKKNG